MSATADPSWISPADYLAMERASPERHEYFQGEMFAMGGASRKHNLITLNASASLHSQLATSDCEIYSSDMRVKISPSGHYVYPDVVVTCVQPRFEDDQLDTLLNPQAIIEVLSESTEQYDRGKKFERYRQIESLQEYFLVAQDRPHVERFERGEAGAWVLTEATGLEATIDVKSAGCTLKLGDVYAKVTPAES